MDEELRAIRAQEALADSVYDDFYAPIVQVEQVELRSTRRPCPIFPEDWD